MPSEIVKIPHAITAFSQVVQHDHSFNSPRVVLKLKKDNAHGATIQLIMDAEKAISAICGEPSSPDRFALKNGIYEDWASFNDFLYLTVQTLYVPYLREEFPEGSIVKADLRICSSTDWNGNERHVAHGLNIERI